MPALGNPITSACNLTRYNVTAELTATERCSVLRLTFHEGDGGRLIVTPPGKGKIEVQGRKILGCSQEPDSFGMYFVVELDRGIQVFGTFENSKVYEGQVGPQWPRRRRLCELQDGRPPRRDRQESELPLSATSRPSGICVARLAPWGSMKFVRGRRPPGRSTWRESKSKAAPRRRERRSTHAFIGP